MTVVLHTTLVLVKGMQVVDQKLNIKLVWPDLLGLQYLVGDCHYLGM